MVANHLGNTVEETNHAVNNMEYQNISKMSEEEVVKYLNSMDQVEVLSALKYQHVYREEEALEILRESGSPEKCLSRLGSENRLSFFWEFKNDFIQRDIYEFGLYMSMITMNMDMISHNYSAKDLFDLLKDADQKKLQDCGDKLPIKGSIEVFRGVVNDKDESSIHRCSWTLDKNIAAWFAVKCSRNDRSENDRPAVYKRIAPPEAIFYYTNERKEEEVVLDPERCEPVTRLSYMPTPIEWSTEIGL